VATDRIEEGVNHPPEHPLGGPRSPVLKTWWTSTTYIWTRNFTSISATVPENVSLKKHFSPPLYSGTKRKLLMNVGQSQDTAELITSLQTQDDRVLIFRENCERILRLEGVVRPPYGSHDLDLPTIDRGHRALRPGQVLRSQSWRFARKTRSKFWLWPWKSRKQGQGQGHVENAEHDGYHLSREYGLSRASAVDAAACRRCNCCTRYRMTDRNQRSRLWKLLNTEIAIKIPVRTRSDSTSILIMLASVTKILLYSQVAVSNESKW
jgi:hypothetical protein